MPSYCVGQNTGPTTTLDTDLGVVIIQGASKTINNSTNCPGAIGVRDFTNLVVDLAIGGTYTLQAGFVTCGNPYTIYGGAWIDWNRDGVWNLTSEKVFTASAYGNHTTTFTVPDTAIVEGMTRMRIQVKEGGSASNYDICSSFPYGGTKDFGVQIVGAGSGGGGGGGGGGGVSGGGAFLIVLTIVGVLYVVIGCIYNRQRKGTQGMRESCPQNEFWFSLPGLVKDGCLYTKAKTLSLCGKKGTNYGELDDV